MSSDNKRKLVEELIDKEKWSRILHRFVDVLKINLLMVDHEGHVILPPVKDKGGKAAYGCEFLTSPSLGLYVSKSTSDFIKQFEKSGAYLELQDPFNFHAFAIPIHNEQNETIALIVAGPVILNKRLDNERYQQIATKLNFSCANLIGMINEIRVVSFVTIKSILDLLSAIVKESIELKFERMALDRIQFQEENLPKMFSETAQELYSSIHMDELLVSILDVALNMTMTECGSIMVLDEKNEELTIKVSRGINEDLVSKTRLKMGEGIAGLAAQEKLPFIIEGVKGENRIQHLLKRAEIKRSFVMPLISENKVFGVMNLHTKKID